MDIGDRGERQRKLSRLDDCQHVLLLSGCLYLCIILFLRTHYDKPIMLCGSKFK